YANGLSSPLADLAETQALKAALGERAYQVPVTALKSMLGHMIGAAGGVQTASLVNTLNHGVVPPTINLDNPAQGCDLDYTPHTAREGEFRTGLATAFGFGGMNAALVLRRFEG
ncbi:MAG: beta-ketoacyl-[acyl-carrier-protein] synthase II, partial [Desulfovibrio sp.]